MRTLARVMEIVALVAAAAFVVLLFANEPADPADPASSDATSAPADGASLYSANCATCHGDDGGGGRGPALADGAVVEAFPDPAAQIAFVTVGEGLMPGFGDDLTPEEIAAVVEYTRTDLAGG